MQYRTKLKDSDKSEIKLLLISTGFFHDYEIDVAIELVEITLEKGEEATGYYFIIAEEEGKILGYVCFGSTPCTEASWDLYWIAVHKSQMNKGIGGLLVQRCEESVKAMKGKNIWIETSSRDIYKPTRKFYEKKGYSIETELTDFYAPGDNKVIFRKVL